MAGEAVMAGTRSAPTPPEELADTRTVFERVIAILGELPAIGKDARNEQQHFMYRSHDQVLNALNPLLAKHGVFVVPTVIERVEGRRQTKSGSVMYEVNLHVRYTFYGPGGDSFAASAWGEGTDSGDKSTNKAMTMAFKNVLAQTFAVSTADTVDSDAHAPEETVRPADPEKDLMPGAPATPEEIVAELNRFDPTVDWPVVMSDLTQDKYEAASWRDLNVEQRNDFWRRLANSVHWIREKYDDGHDFPPLAPDRLKEGFAYGFSGIVVEIVYQEVPETEEAAPLSSDKPAAEAGDDVPFGEEA